MPLFPLPVEDFGGLDLLHSEDEIGFSGAIDLCDVDLDRPGQLRERDRFKTFVANTSLTTPSLIDWPQIGLVAINSSGTAKLYNTAGTLVGSPSIAAGAYLPSGAQPFGRITGGTAKDYLYLADIGATNTVQRLDTSGVLTAPAGMPKATFLCRTPWDNRLVAAAISAVPTGSSATAGGSLIHFSATGDGETWGADDWIQLDDGDGEGITGMGTWRNFLFVFKASKFYVFYSTTPDGSGGRSFNYRAVRSGTGVVNNISSVATGPDGLYFFGRDTRGNNLFRTQGTEPVALGDAIQPALNSSAPATFTVGNLTPNLVTCAHGRIHMICGNGSVYFILSYNIQFGYWTLTATGSASSPQIGSGPSGLLYVVPNSVNAPIYVQDPTYTGTDALSAPAGRYQSGFDNLAPPRRFSAHYLFGNTRKRFRKWKVTGTGTVRFGVAHDFGSVGQTSTLTLGTSPTIKDAWHNIASRGQLISYKVTGSGTSPWSVQKLTAYLAGSEPPLLGNPSDQ